MIYLQYKIYRFIATHFSESFCYRIARFIATLDFLLFPRKRRKVLKNLSYILKDEGKKKVRRVALNLYRNFAMNIADYFFLSFKWDREEFGERIILNGADEKLQELASSKKGIIIPTAHLGNWEVAGFILGYMGYRSHGIGLPQKDKRIEEQYKKMREKANVLVHPVKGGAASVYRALKNNEVASIVSDRDVNKDGIKVNFFGRCVTFPGGTALLAYKSGARSIFGFALREGKKYRAYLGPEIIIDRSKGEKAFIKEYVQTFATILENHIRRFPDRWYNFFDYFEEYKCS